MMLTSVGFISYKIAMEGCPLPNAQLRHTLNESGSRARRKSPSAFGYVRHEQSTLSQEASGTCDFRDILL